MSGSANGRTAATTGAGAARHVRNVVVVGPTGAGKTMLVESLLYANKDLTRLGSVDEGSATTDHLDVEKRLGHSVSLSVATFTVADSALTGGLENVQVTLLDTPGHPDFVGDLRAGLRAADAALFVVSSVDGVNPGTAMLWRECALEDMPRAVVVTHLDQQRASFAETVATCTAAFGEGVHPIYVPLGEESLGLLSRTVRSGDGGVRDATEGELDGFEDLRSEVVEAIITESEDEGLLERYLGGEEISFDQIVADLTKAVARGSFFPALAANPIDGTGAREVIELICRGFPTPAQHHMPDVFTPQGGTSDPIEPSEDAPLVAEVVKTSTDAYVGRISVVRVFSGTLAPDSQVHVSGHLAQFTGDERDEEWHRGHDEDTRAGALSAMLGGRLTPVPKAVAGDIVAVANLASAETGDTLSDPERPVVVEPWTFPHPLLPVAIRAATTKDEDKLMRGLARIQAENPTSQVVVDTETGQLVLWTMGESQLELLLDTLKERDGVSVETEPVRVAVHETVRAQAQGIGRHVKQSGGHGQYAIAHITIEPLGEGGGFEFVDEVVGGAVPRQFIPSVEKGIRSQMEQGVTGYPMVDIRVRLTGGKAHSVDSSDAAFQTAGALALKEAAAAAGIQLLEPIEDVAITVDDEFVGAVMNDLASRRGRVRGTEPASDPGRTTVTAHVPAFELVRYTQVLRSLGHGSGTFTRSPDHYAPAPTSVQERLTEVAS
ncbi:elongation factor G-like protein EF-G2 [Nostocoides sp. F2B08]|uniref:elongation factor G-like protein EF-G2 n=1 Tax=Nostocoides sp. F2B08 TaxID=2653936 RepID=UPI001263026A|nr:elongation factor G-like protein EF-G2 [Tetrasphaera sp. F2B08]KAB7741831.1 elongation factor G-like protein EF-G2 [Tetrasphaera sp. F2B08]